jgi:hypothetical protein
MTAQKTSYTPDPDVYWAAQDREQIGPAVADAFRCYADRVKADGRLAVWRMADRAYHGRNPDGASYANAHEITFAGKSGEVAQIHVGHYRQIVGAQLTIATESRPGVECTATSNDPEAISDTIVARQLLEYDLDEGGLEDDLHTTHERALTFGEGFLVQTWDHHAGELVGTRELSPGIVDDAEPGIPGVEPGSMPTDDPMALMMAPPVEMPVREGRVRVEVRSPLDVARDLDRDEFADQPWYVVRTRVHRWELAARYPEDAAKREAILSAPGVGQDSWSLRSSKLSTGRESDYVYKLTLYHPPSDALPQGRIVEVVDEQPLEDEPYPYDHMVVHHDVPSLELDSAQGYGDSWDMLAVSQALDASESGMLSVADAGSLIRWRANKDSKTDTRQLDQGMTLVEFASTGQPGERGPELMERPEVRGSDLEYTQHHRKNLEMLSGINATLRGSAESEVKSGADRALIATMAVRANSKHQRSLAKLIRSVLNGRVKLYKQFCTEERLVEIAGRDKSGHVASFSSQTLENVRRVRVDIGPPELRLAEGKIALADEMLEAFGPEVITPAKYLALRTLGRLDDIDDLIAEQKALARKENDALRDGRAAEVKCMVFHHHEIHIAEHTRDLMNVEIIGDANRLTEIMTRLAHLNEHVMQWSGTPPEILQATGQRPAPSTLMGPGAAPPGAPPMPPPGMPANDNGAPPQPMAANDNGQPPAVLDAGPNGPGLPQMPMVAGTNERFTPGQPPPGVQ